MSHVLAVQAALWDSAQHAIYFPKLISPCARCSLVCLILG